MFLLDKTSPNSNMSPRIIISGEFSVSAKCEMAADMEEGFAL
jgi:hypothetical protein